PPHPSSPLFPYTTLFRSREQLFKAELISPEDLSLFKITTDLDEAVEEILGFYTVYNSMRYVRDRLVLRLHAEPDDALMQRLNDRSEEHTSELQSRENLVC